MKREKKWDKAQKLRALVVELSVAAEDMVEYNNVDNDELYMLPSMVFEEAQYYGEGLCGEGEVDGTHTTLAR